MPILAMYAGIAVGQQSYEDIKNDIGWEAAPPAGALLHLVGFDELDQVFEATLWETEEDHDAYRRDHLLPAARRAGVDLPRPQLIPLHNAAISPLADQYMTRVSTTAILGAPAVA